MPGSRDDELFRLDKVFVEVGAKRVLDEVDLVVPAGCLTVLAGPSGAGKTTLLRLLNRLDVPTRGTVALRGTDLATIEATGLRRDVAMVFQRPPIFPGTVADNLRVTRADLTDSEVEAALVEVDLDAGIADQKGATLSGGEAQRMCFARALLNEPTVVLADEPTSALDPAPKRALEDLVGRLVGTGLSVVWVSHDAAQVRRLADHLVVLDRGRVRAQGSLGDLVANRDPVVQGVLAVGR